MPLPRVLQVIKYADDSGAPRHVFTLLEQARDRFEAQLCVGVADPCQRRLEQAGLRVHVLSVIGQRAGPLQSLRSVLALRKLIRTQDIALVHAHSPLAGATARIAAALAGVPCVFTAHGWNFAPGLPWQRRLASWLLEWLTARLGQPIIAVSAHDAALAERLKIAHAPQLQVIHNGIADRPCPVRSIEPAATPLITMVARFWDQKRQQDLIEAVAGIDRPLRVRFIGDGECQARCEALAHRLGQDGRIEFLGRLDDVDPLLDESDVFVLSSNHEGLPLAILEAMRAALPVVASRVGGVAEAVDDGNTGLLFERGDVAALRRHLLRLLEDPGLRRRMGAAGRMRFEQCFTQTRMLRDTFALYERLLPARALS